MLPVFAKCISFPCVLRPLFPLGILGVLSCSPSSEPFGTGAAPDTFVLAAPPGLTYRNEVAVSWSGSDPDGAVVAFQRQLVAVDSLHAATDGERGDVLASIEPLAETGDENWTDPASRSDRTYEDLEDGWYEFRVRAVDDTGEVDPTPARLVFRVLLDDRSPWPEILQVPPHQCGRLAPVQSHTFLVSASDLTTSDTEIPRRLLEYSWWFRTSNQSACIYFELSADWQRFPEHDRPIPIEVSLGPDPAPGCDWTFTLRARDPAGNVASVTCEIRQPPGGSPDPR